jgi:hypothetical protein
VTEGLPFSFSTPTANQVLRAASLGFRGKGQAYGGCEGRSTAPLNSRSVRGVQLNCRSSTQIFASTKNLQHCRISDQLILTADDLEAIVEIQHQVATGSDTD